MPLSRELRGHRKGWGGKLEAAGGDEQRDFNDSRCSPTRGVPARLKQIAEGIAPQPLAFHPVIPIICLPAAGKDPSRPKYRDATVDIIAIAKRRNAIILLQRNYQ